VGEKPASPEEKRIRGRLHFYRWEKKGASKEAGAYKLRKLLGALQESLKKKIQKENTLKEKKADPRSRGKPVRGGERRKRVGNQRSILHWYCEKKGAKPPKRKGV